MEDWSEWFPTPSLRWLVIVGLEKVLEQRFERTRPLIDANGYAAGYETEEEWRPIECTN